MRITHGRISDHQFLLIQYPFRNSLRTFFIQHLLQTRFQRIFCRFYKARSIKHLCACQRIVNTDVTDVFQHTCCTVLAVLEVKECRCVINIFCIALAGNEYRVI